MFEQGVVVFDGAIGTELYERGFYINRPFEELNLSAASDVEALHRAYIEAGAQVLTTNTFSIVRTQLRKFDIEAKQEELLIAGLAIANKARAGSQVRVALSLGPTGELVEPLGPTSREDVYQEYRRLAQMAKNSGHAFELYNLETFTNMSELESAIEGLRAIDPITPILACVSAKAGQTALLSEFAKRIGSRADVQALGLNCSEGPSEILSQLKILAPLSAKPLVVQPNAGIPRQINGRYFYMTSPDYLAKYAGRYVESGASGVGGCCGTGPNHIHAIATAVRMMNSKRSELSQGTRAQSIQNIMATERMAWDERKESRIGQLVAERKKFLSVELTSPKGTDLTQFLANLNLIEKAGLEFVNVPDGPRASTRVNALHLASYVKHARKGNLRVLPHFTARDRNLIALQADLLGASINGISDILLVTGDPPKLGNNRDATGVYDIDSIGLTHLVDCLNRGSSPSGDGLGSRTGFGIGVASNPTSVNFALEMERWRYKVEMGADFAVTQPLYEPESFFRWRDSIGVHYRPHMIGVWPFVSLRNAEFMANEVPGVSVPAWALAEMAKAGENAEEAIKRGIEIALRLMTKLDDACEGFCVSAPLGKVPVALSLIAQWRPKEL